MVAVALLMTKQKRQPLQATPLLFQKQNQQEVATNSWVGQQAQLQPTLVITQAAQLM